MTAFILAVQFLTRIPVPYSIKASDEQLGQSVLFYPVIGLFIGGFLALVAFLLQGNAISLQAAILLTFWVLITGGLHLDGLADCADGWAGGLGNPQRSLEIMKDPASGAIAVVVLILVLLLKWTALSSLLEQDEGFSQLIIIPALGRSAILALMLSSPYVSPNGLGEKLIRYLPKTAAALVLSTMLALGFYIVGFWALFYAGLMLLAIRFLAHQRLGGVTGDVYGAAVELLEMVLLIAVVFH
ncbi:MAG: adenosylcobinamide-GDP ribazoletransferase [Methylococcaceae bacterium]|nr:adenosylcobinamide-GDP ribazoletransferase [Methylococcaceae bacterium]